jgi:hypothetical protein
VKIEEAMTPENLNTEMELQDLAEANKGWHTPWDREDYLFVATELAIIAALVITLAIFG